MLWQMVRAFLLFALAAVTVAADCTPLPLAKPEEVGLQSERLKALLARAKQGGTDGFVVLKDGRFVGGFGVDVPLQIYSVTKPITGMAAGWLFTEGKWTDLDAPVSQFLTEMAGDPKGVITLRQLMSHTSGIRDARDEKQHVLREWNEAKDWVKASLQRPIDTPPGTAYKYNNQGPALVAAAVERTAGQRMDQFLARTIFGPMCIGKFQWETDKAGHAAGYTGLKISAYDLAKLGQLVLNRGVWRGERLLSEDWIRQSAHLPSQTVNPNVGLLWFVKMESPRFPISSLTFHSGDGGQYLLLFPNHGIVVARLRNSGDAQDFPIAQLAVDHLIRAPRN
jgi:CubicO group peptidase (beta-lactamase class C family)